MKKHTQNQIQIDRANKKQPKEDGGVTETSLRYLHNGQIKFLELTDEDFMLCMTDIEGFIRGNDSFKNLTKGDTIAPLGISHPRLPTNL